MKKQLIALVLVVIMSISVLSSCDIPEKPISTESEGTGDVSGEGASIESKESDSEAADLDSDNSESVNSEESESEPKPETEVETETETDSPYAQYMEFFPLPDGTFGVSAGKTQHLTELSIPSKYDGMVISCILENGFKNLTVLTDVTVCAGIVKIGDSAFADCSALKCIVIPNSVTEIGKNVFAGCGKLEKIIFSGTRNEAANLFRGALTLSEGQTLEIECGDGKSLIINAGDSQWTDSGKEENASDFFPDVERQKYNSDFYFYYAPSQSVEHFYMDDDLNDGSPMDEAVYNRQEKVERYLGIEVVKVTFPDAKFNDYNKYVQTAVLNMDGTIDALITHVNGAIGPLISDNLLLDLSELEGLDLEAEYWNLEFMETLKLKDNYFLGFSDYNPLYTHVVTFNKEMLALYESSMDKSIYDLVKDKEWTLDEMISLASLVYTDKTGDGKTTDDTYGITGVCWVPFCGFLTSSNIPMMEGGRVAINQSQYFEKADDLVTKLRDLDASNSAYFDHDFSKCSVPLTSGRALMQLQSTYAIPSMLAYNVEFGILPYPMYDLNQASVGYKSLQWGGYIAVPSYLKNAKMVGEALELLSFYSENVQITFYEKLLGAQLADKPDDAAMLDIIWDSVATDAGQTFITASGVGDKGICYTIPDLIWQEANKNLASYVKSKETAINEGFKKFMSGIK